MKNTMKENPSQKTRILLYLKAGNKLTSLDALNRFNCLRLSGRIWNIRQMGFQINMELITTNTNKVIAEYELIKGCYQTNLF